MRKPEVDTMCLPHLCSTLVSLDRVSSQKKVLADSAVLAGQQDQVFLSLQSHY